VERIRGTLDHRIPDDLPMTAGEWLAMRLAQLRIGVHSLVTDKDDDAYRTFDRIIQLRDTTHFKADPVYWATAAHELGHARIRAMLPILGHLRTCTMYFNVPLVAAGVAMLVGHVLYGVPIAGDLAFSCFVVAAATRIFVLVDEAAASILAYRELRALEHRGAVRSVLLAAFATYFVTYVSYALLLAQWSLVDTLVMPSTAMELTAFGWIVVGLMSILAVVGAVLRLVEMFEPREYAKVLDGRTWLTLLTYAVRGLPIVVLVMLVWDYRSDPAYAWCVIAALAASSSIWTLLAHVPIAIPWLVVRSVLKRFSGPGHHRTARYLLERFAGSSLVRAGNKHLDVLRDWWRDNPPLPERLLALSKLGYVPLLVAFWLKLAA
jgi:hypothetical protein